MSSTKEKGKDGDFTPSERIQVVILLIFNTLFSWLIFHFGWKDMLPQKARLVSRYLLRIIGVLVGLTVLGVIVTMALISAR